MAAVTAPTRYRFNVDEYYRMVDAGILMDDDPVELWEGEIIVMSPIGTRHAKCVTVQNELFVQQSAGRAVVRLGLPVRLSTDTEPEPDLAVVRPRADTYGESHPTPQEVFLIIEVSDSTLAYDGDIKIPRYAREGFPEAWIWDLRTDRVYVYTEPSPEGYRSMRVYGRGDVVSPVAFPDVRIPVDAAL